MGDVDPFLAQAQRRGLVTAAQVEDCLRIAATLAEVKVELTIDEIAARKGFVTAEQGAEIRRALARLRVGRYEVVDLLGEGAAGVVWRARDTKLDRIVALKVLSQRAQEFPAFRERFAREARIAVTLNHVNIVHGLDYGEADGYQYFAMEFVEGENAEKRLKRVGRFSENDAVSIAVDAVRALQYVQRFHVVHHDIKPSNLLLTAGGHSKLCDLGLAKPMLAEAELMGGDGTTAGTPSYMSPEQIEHPERMDWRGDVYSLGATLYHLLTGEPPFKAGTRSAVLDKHLHAAPASPREHVLELSDGVAAVVLRMLQKSPDERYASLDDLAADLESVLAGREPRHAMRTTSPAAVTAERHAHMAVAHRAAESRGGFPWTAAALGTAVVGAIVAVVLSVSGGRPKASTTPTSDGERASTASARPESPSRIEPPKPPDAPPKPAASPQRDAAIESRAATQLEERTKRARVAAQEGRFAAARAELDLFLAEFAATDSAKAAKEELVGLDAAAHSRFDEIAKKADDAAARRRFEEAKSLFDEAAKVEAPWAEGKARSARATVDAAAGKYERDRDAQAALFADTYAEALVVFGQTGRLDSARAVVDRAARSLDVYEREVSSLREDLDVLDKYGTDPDAIDGTGRRGATALLLARLAKGQVAAAERGLDELGANGGDAAEARARIARVGAYLTRQAAAKLDQAEEALAGRNFVSAARRVDEALALTPGSVRARVLLGRIRLEGNEVDNALQILGDVACRPDAPPEAHLWLGRALRTKGDDPARAETEIERFLAAAQAADASRSDVETELSAMRARRIDAEVRRWRDVAKNAVKKGDAARAEGAWGRIAELLKGDDPESLLQLGQIYVDRKLTAPAFVALSRIKQLRANDTQKRKAADLLAKMKGSGLPTEDGQEFVAVADKYFAAENWDKAIQNYQAALMVSPHLSTARGRQIRAFLARCREKGVLDDARAAADAATTLVNLFPDEASPLALRSDASLLLGDVKRALEDAGNAVKADAKCALAQLALGRASVKSGDFAKGKDAFLAAYKSDPTPEALIGLARCQEKTEDFESAKKTLDDLKERFGVPPTLFAEYQELTRGLPTDK